MTAYELLVLGDLWTWLEQTGSCIKPAHHSELAAVELVPAA